MLLTTKDLLVRLQAPRFFMERDEVLAMRDKGPVNVRAMVEQCTLEGPDKVKLTVVDMKDKKMRLEELLKALLGRGSEELSITRLCMYGKKDGRWVPPIEVNRSFPTAS